MYWEWIKMMMLVNAWVDIANSVPILVSSDDVEIIEHVLGREKDDDDEQMTKMVRGVRKLLGKKQAKGFHEICRELLIYVSI
ncbi:hypothetical protein AVEN_211833-1 [Araneus ventricosus]|uniref:CARD domain-containing protein n=1 Tax=Araneus ventricosus TaxID=182803 RepID=A0A4Y2HIS2_ARAVE|nr:hypothetical protein AVEN_211833-1 [Araneus ventricosus]